MQLEHNFVPARLPANLTGLDAALLADLCDLVSKFGQDVTTDGKTRNLGMTLGTRQVHVAVSLGEVITMIFSPWACYVRPDHSVAFPTVGDTCHVVSDTAITTQDIVAFVAEFNALTESLKAFGRNGERPRMPSELFIPKVPVEAAFPNGQGFYTYAAGVTVEQAMDTFDKPNELVVEFVGQERSPCGFIIRRKETYLQQAIQAEAIRRVSKRHGFTKLSQLQEALWDPRSTVGQEFTDECLVVATEMGRFAKSG